MGGASREARAAVADDGIHLEVDVREADAGEDGPEDRDVLVRRAMKVWRRRLIDTSGNNRLLSYRDMTAGTLDMTPAGKSGAVLQAADRLLRGEQVRLLEMYPDESDASDALRRLSNIRAKAQIVLEEKGVDTQFVALGLARWQPDESKTRPNAPVVLVPVAVQPVDGAESDFVLECQGDPFVNPVLGLVLRVESRISGLEGLLDRHLAEGPLSVADASRLLQRIEVHCSQIPGFKIVPRAVMGNFSYAAMPMVLDLEGHVAHLMASDLVAAAAGSTEARMAFAAKQSGTGASRDIADLGEETLVLDADSTQLEAVRRALAGESLVIQGPPGTGKSQTIVNLIASLVAAGKRVLFVAEKRVALEAVEGRLADLGLRDLILDFRGGAGARRTLLESIGRSLGSLAPVSEGELSVVDRLESVIDELRSHTTDLHDAETEWGVSRYEAFERAVGRRGTADTLRVNGVTLERIEELADLADEWLALGGHTLVEEHPEWTPMVHGDRARIRRAFEDLVRLQRELLPAALTALRHSADDVRLDHPDSLDGWNELIELFRDVETFQRRYDPAIYKQNLEATVLDLATADDNPMGRMRAKLSSSRYRRAVRSVRAVSDGDRRRDDLLADTMEAIEHKRQWVMRRRDGRLPRVPDGLENAEHRLAAVIRQLERFSDWFPVETWRAGPTAHLEATLAHMVGDEGLADRLPRIASVESDLGAAGLGDVLREASQGDLAPAEVRSRLLDAWVVGVAEAVVDEAFDGEHHSERQREFRRLDRIHLESARDRLRERVASEAATVIERHPEEAQLVRSQVEREHGHLAPRQLIERAPHVLGALRPCWMMSPLLVSELLPPGQDLFDVVVFDEASQVISAEAIPSLARASQAVIAGDSHQLPPTTFFTKTVIDEEVGEDDTAHLNEFGSILEAMTGVLGEVMLRRHYRSRDERLIEFSNREIYDDGVWTFPGTAGPSPVRHVLVDEVPPDVSGTRSNPYEVERVVELILEHAEWTPERSLGVIAMGQAHAANIERELRRRLAVASSDGLDWFMGQREREPFFIKNLERVQGDERDAVILSIGYHKRPDGVLPYAFGPLHQAGGERRLNVAVTRARSSLTLVSSFGADDMDPERSHADGVELLRRYLAAIGAADDSEDQRTIDPIIEEIGAHLARAGVPVELSYGRSTYRVEIAGRHPEDQDRLVIAFETDGRVYRAGRTVRERDRLTDEALERLGWRIHRIWTEDWIRDPKGETRRAVEAWVEAVIAADESMRA